MDERPEITIDPDSAIGHPALYLVERTPRGWSLAELSGSGLDWSRMEWPTRAYLRGACAHILGRINEAEDVERSERNAAVDPGPL